jgi:hypothetical protein
MSLGAGERLGQYAILSPIKAGGMGEVYKARHTRLAEFQHQAVATMMSIEEAVNLRNKEGR